MKTAQKKPRRKRKGKRFDRDYPAAYGKPLHAMPSPADLKRFLSFIEVQANGCWFWTANTDFKGYGRFWFAGRNVWAHRFAVQVFKGILAIGEQANHEDMCRCPTCVNPLHLSGLSIGENTADGNRNRERERESSCAVLT